MGEGKPVEFLAGNTPVCESVNDHRFGFTLSGGQRGCAIRLPHDPSFYLFWKDHHDTRNQRPKSECPEAPGKAFCLDTPCFHPDQVGCRAEKEGNESEPRCLAE